MFEAIKKIIEFITEFGGEYSIRGGYSRGLEGHMMQVAMPVYAYGNEVEQLYKLLEDEFFREKKSKDEQFRLFVRDELEVWVRL